MIAGSIARPGVPPCWGAPSSQEAESESLPIGRLDDTPQQASEQEPEPTRCPALGLVFYEEGAVCSARRAAL